MRYLRMLSNSLAAGALATAYVLILVLQLNSTLPLNPVRLAPLAATVGVFYAVHLTVICYVLLVVRQLFAREVFSPAWVSVGVLLWLGAFAAAAGAFLMWENLHTFGRVLDEPTAIALETGVATLGAAAIAFVLLAWLRRSFGPAHRGIWAMLLLAIACTSIVVPMAARGRGTLSPLEARPFESGIDFTASDRPSRVTVIGIDAGSLDVITSAAAEGRLPNFGRILDAGAVMHLATLHPTSAEAVWAAVATGKLPQENGVRSAGIYRLSGTGEAVHLLPNFCFAYGLVRFGFLVEERHTSAALRSRPIWSILGTHGFSVGVVGWPLTQPAPAVRGYVVSDTYLRLASTATGVVDSPAVYPPEIEGDVMLAAEAALAEHAPVVPASTLSLEPRHEAPGRTDRVYDRIAFELARTRPAHVTLTRYRSLDPIGHYFLRYAMPARFGERADEEHRALASVLERHYALIDEAVGRAMASLGPDDLLLVVSGFGMEPLGLGKRAIERLIGDPEVSGTHDNAPDGFLMAYGAPVARGRPLARASAVDVTPTILYFLGLPVGRDMDGYARTDIFQRAFTEERPITSIPSYDR